LSKIQWTPDTMENVVTRRVLESWSEAGFEEVCL
jgi:hypothetical protein